MQILRPDQFSGDSLTVHIELEETMSPYIESDVYNPAYFQAVVQKAHDLFDALFEEGDAILLVYHVYGIAFTPTHLFRFIRDRNARFKTTLTRSFLHEEIIRTYGADFRQVTASPPCLVRSNLSSRLPLLAKALPSPLDVSFHSVHSSKEKTCAVYL